MLLEERPARAQIAASVGSESPLSCMTDVVALISSFLRIDSIPSFGMRVPDDRALANSKLDIEYQNIALGPRHAGQHPVASKLLILAEKDIAMIRDALEHTGQASSADALRAGRIDTDAVLGQHLDDRLSRRDREDSAASRKLDLKCGFGPSV